MLTLQMNSIPPPAGLLNSTLDDIFLTEAQKISFTEISPHFIVADCIVRMKSREFKFLPDPPERTLRYAGRSAVGPYNALDLRADLEIDRPAGPFTLPRCTLGF